MTFDSRCVPPSSLTGVDTIRSVKLRHLLPVPVRRTLRRIQRELPTRVRDLPADFRDAWAAGSALPPARLRYNVAGTTSRADFVAIGQRAAAEIMSAVEPYFEQREELSVLDFGVGSGRVARPMIDILRSRFEHLYFAGADVDAAAVSWCARSIPGEYVTINSSRLPFVDGRFDLVYAVSIFTHMDEEEQWRWLSELQRVLRPGGILVATTHSPHLVFERPDLPARERERLNESGFAFVAGYSTFNERSAFHSRQYIERAWARSFELLAHVEFGLGGYQDIAVLRARA